MTPIAFPAHALRWEVPSCPRCVRSTQHGASNGERRLAVGSQWVAQRSKRWMCHHQIEKKLVWPATIVRTCSGWQTSEVAGIISTPAIKLASENLDSLMRVTPGTKGKSMRATLVQRQTSKAESKRGLGPRHQCFNTSWSSNFKSSRLRSQVLAGRPFKKDLKLFKAQLKSSSRGLKSLTQQVWDPKAATWSPVPCLA
ncbi:hypothetical protein DFH08DRAFT_813371 [Mycena albidolilacea]|uniref:Uncharacterized protein n=1 Tax=Mycena albidolilacea TaxID=1033008 RepID=A0AAD6ZRB6_9AGAR|nr:hypothetical protein DFH08DRAFT_813371 [Mycena albidolilacea]